MSTALNHPIPAEVCSRFLDKLLDNWNTKDELENSIDDYLKSRNPPLLTIQALVLAEELVNRFIDEYSDFLLVGEDDNTKETNYAILDPAICETIKRINDEMLAIYKEIGQ